MDAKAKIEMFQEEIQSLEQYKSFGHVTLDDAIAFCKRVIETETRKEKEGSTHE